MDSTVLYGWGLGVVLEFDDISRLRLSISAVAAIFILFPKSKTNTFLQIQSLYCQLQHICSSKLILALAVKELLLMPLNLKKNNCKIIVMTYSRKVMKCYCYFHSHDVEFALKISGLYIVANFEGKIHSGQHTWMFFSRRALIHYRPYISN